MAIGITFAGTGLGSLLLTPGAEFLITRFDWRTAYLVLAGLAVAVVPFIVIFLRLNPSKMGLQIDGEETAGSPIRFSPQTTINWHIRDIIRTPSFWLVLVAAAGAIGPLRMLTVHQLAVMADAGFARLFGATVVGLAGAVTAVAFILFGILSDRFGRRGAYAIGSVCLLLAMGLLGSLPRLVWPGWLWLYAVMLGLGEGSRSSLVTAVASDLFPGSALGAVNGAVGSAFGLGAAVFPWLAGILFDQTGSYNIAFETASMAILLSTIALWLAPKYASAR
jgi:MFS family permease